MQYFFTKHIDEYCKARYTNVKQQAAIADNDTEDINMIFENIKDIIVEILGVNKDIVTADTNIKDLTMDSLEMYDILNAIEEEFDISVPEDAIDEIKTVNDIVNYIEKTIEPTE